MIVPDAPMWKSNFGRPTPSTRRASVSLVDFHTAVNVSSVTGLAICAHARRAAAVALSRRRGLSWGWNRAVSGSSSLSTRSQASFQAARQAFLYAGFTEPSASSMFSSAVSRFRAADRWFRCICAHTYARKGPFAVPLRVSAIEKDALSVLFFRISASAERVGPSASRARARKDIAPRQTVSRSQKSSPGGAFYTPALFCERRRGPTPNAIRRTGELRRRTRCLQRRRKKNEHRGPPPRRNPPLPAPHRSSTPPTRS